MEKNVDGKLIKQSVTKKSKTNISKSKADEAKKYKNKYFDFYDDVKDRTHKVVDW